MKEYNTMQKVGMARYIVNFHNGEKTHTDGSKFFDMRTFKNKIKRDNFIKELQGKGYNEN